MLALKTFIGKRLDLEHYKGVAMDRTIEVFDEDNDEFTLGSDEVLFDLFAKPHGKLIVSNNLGVMSGNDIVLNDQVLDYRADLYYHECYQMTNDSPSQKILLFYGVSEIL